METKELHKDQLNQHREEGRSARRLGWRGDPSLNHVKKVGICHTNLFESDPSLSWALVWLLGDSALKIVRSFIV